MFPLPSVFWVGPEASRSGRNAPFMIAKATPPLGDGLKRSELPRTVPFNFKPAHGVRMSDNAACWPGGLHPAR
jgi:hypothetical protein